MAKAKEKRDCFICKYCAMCEAFRKVNELIPFDSNKKKYSQNYSNLFVAVAEICRMFTKEEKKQNGK